jgi:type IV pilus assembly protein PilV
MILPVKFSKESGFTLVEFVVAVLILLVGLLALLQTVTYSITVNDTNKMRNDATLMADEIMSRERVKPFANIVTASPITRSINYGLTTKNLTVTETVTDMTTTSKRVQLTVSWQDKGATKNHYLTTIISAVPAN